MGFQEKNLFYNNRIILGKQKRRKSVKKLRTAESKEVKDIFQIIFNQYLGSGSNR